MKCVHCGFDFEQDNVKIEGAPCGYRGCTQFVCCYEGWLKHLKEDHKLTNKRIEELE